VKHWVGSRGRSNLWWFSIYMPMLLWSISDRFDRPNVWLNVAVLLGAVYSIVSTVLSVLRAQVRLVLENNTLWTEDRLHQRSTSSLHLATPPELELSLTSDGDERSLQLQTTDGQKIRVGSWYRSDWDDNPIHPKFESVRVWLESQSIRVHGPVPSVPPPLETLQTA
jgi:hypothetical protein